MGPLAGLRILDMTTVLMGPYATQILGDLGADVTKVEPPEGDIVRHIGPDRSPGMGGMFLTNNRSKRSIVLDLKRAAGREAFLRLVVNADVLITNIRPKAMERLQLNYQQVAVVNPAIIYMSLVGYGQNGPYAARPAYDDLIQGASGLAALSSEAGSEQPRYAPITIADRVVGLHAATATLAAVVHRDRTGQGQLVEVPMFETMASFVLGDHMSGLVFDPPLNRGGYERLLAHDRRPFETRDGHICVLIYNDAQWRRFFTLVERPDMLDDPRLRDHGTRTRHVRELYGEVAAILQTRTTAAWLEALGRADIPCAKMNAVGDLLDDPHLQATGFFRVSEHPSEGQIRDMKPATTWSHSQPEPMPDAPRLGEHGPAILAEAGCSNEEIAAWLSDGGCIIPGKA